MGIRTRTPAPPPPGRPPLPTPTPATSAQTPNAPPARDSVGAAVARAVRSGPPERIAPPVTPSALVLTPATSSPLPNALLCAALTPGSMELEFHDAEFVGAVHQCGEADGQGWVE